jgi:CMP-N,N'-diacetyllegionaminic acid synthase
MTLLAVIPARGGSKGVPRKNIRLLAGKPLIAWTIEAARQCPEVNRLIVTTEDAEIAAVASQWGAEVPFMRPADLAHDDTPGMAPILHALRWLAESERYRPDWVMVLQPTSPLRTAADISAAIALTRAGASSVVSVTQAHPHPYLMKQIAPDGTLQPFDVQPQSPDNRRQAFPPVYALNGAVYLSRYDSVLTNETFVLPDTKACIMPPERSIDIDTLWDFQLADMVLRAAHPA